MMSINDISTWGEFIDEVKARLVYNVLDHCEDNPGQTLEQAAQSELNRLCDDIYRCIERDGFEEIVEEAKKYLEEE